MVPAVLIAVALLAGVAGSWSPCGLSMVETLERARWGTVTFAVGALAGGAITFGGLAWVGDQLGFGGGVAAAVAVAILLVCAIGDGAGRRIVPQVRRQVPESWRRILPVPAAAALYGVLLGLGFTTFLLSYATWGLALGCLAIGTPATGLAVGVAFAAGRAIPIAVLATRDEGAAAMAARPDLLTGLRRGLALGLAAAAALLIATPPTARAADTAGYDPSATGTTFAYQPPSGPGVLVRGGQSVTLPGAHPAVTDGLIAWAANGAITVADITSLAPAATIAAPGADAIALSGSYVAWRAGRQILAVALGNPTAPPVVVTTVSGRQSLGRPTLDGDKVLFDSQKPSVSRLLQRNLSTGKLTRLMSATDAMLLAPSRTPRGLLYIRSSYRRQQVLLGGKIIFSTTPTARRDNGYEDGHHLHHQGYPDGKRPALWKRPAVGLTVTLWTSAFGAGTVYITRLRHFRGGRTQTKILRVGA